MPGAATDTAATENIDVTPSAEEARSGLEMIDRIMGDTVLEEDVTETPDTTVGGDGEDGEGGEENTDLEDENAETEGEEQGEEPEAKLATTAKATPSKPAEKVEEKPAAETVAKKDLRAERKRINIKLANLRQQIKDKGELDYVDDGPLIKEINDTLLEAAQIQDEFVSEIDAEVVAPKQQEEAVDAYWANWKNPDIDADTAFAAWEDCVEAAKKKNKSDEAVLAVARDRFEQKLEQIRAGKKSAAAEKEKEQEKANAPKPKVPVKTTNPAAPPVNKGGGQPVPAASPIRTVAKPKEPEASQELKDKWLNL